MAWKMKARQRRDCFQESDQFDGMGDQIHGWEDNANPSLAGSPKEVKFIMKDETNFEITNKIFKRRKPMF